MVKRTPPLAVAVIGTGEASKKSVEALLTDYTAPYVDVTLILPVTDEHWTDTIGVIADWALENEVPYVAVTTSESPSKALVPYLEGAENVQKVARVSTKLVQLLQQEKADGDVGLLVAWDEEDGEAVAAVNKALNAEVPAYNLLDGLDEFSFDDDEEGQDDSVDHDALDAKQTKDEPDPEGDDEERAGMLGDDYDSWGVRKLRAALREHPNKKQTDRQIGQLDKDDAIRALRLADQAALKGEETTQDVDEEADEAPTKAERTTRARRAFREGVAEATGQDEAQVDLPNSRGGTLLEEQTGDPDKPEYPDLDPRDVDPDTYETEDGEDVNLLTTKAAGSGAYEDTGLRQLALDMAIRGGKSGTEAVADAMKYEVYLKGERKSPGRPRQDGTPAQPREINPETGKPVRRRRAAGSTD